MSQVSTASENSVSPTGGSNNPTKVSRENLHYYLVDAARNMRRIELGVGITGWLCVVVIFMLAAILIDHWLWPLNTIARFAVLTFLLAWTLWWVPRNILPLLFQSIHPEHAARKIEKQYPEMKESLISWLQLSTNIEQTAPRGVLATVGRFAVRNLGGQDSNTIIDSANLIRLAALLFGFMLTGAVYLFASPKSGTTSIARMLMPWSSIAPAARVRIVDVAPGSSKITQGNSLPVTATVRGMHKGDQVFLRYDLSDGQQVGQKLKMSEEIEGVYYRLDFGKSFGGIHQPLRYWIDAGDSSAGPFDLSVQVVPIVAIDRIDFEYPKYTRQKSRSLPQDGTIEAPEGTRVKLFAHANQPMVKSRLEFDPIVGNGVLHSLSHFVDLETRETQLSGAWLLQLDKNRTNPTLSSYRIKATNALNESNSDPVIYKLKIVGDLPPEVRLQSDLSANIEVPIDGSLDIEMRAVDPDFGLVSLTASGKRTNGMVNKEKVFEKACFESLEGTTNQVVRVFNFVPSEYDLKVGDSLEFIAIAKDNRCKVGEDSPEPNEASSTPLVIRIVTAASNPQASKETKPNDKLDEPKTNKNKSVNKASKGNQPPGDNTKADERDNQTESKKPDSKEQANEKQKKDKGSKQAGSQEKDKANEKGSGQSESGSSGGTSDSESSNERNDSGSQSNSSKSNGSKSKSPPGSGDPSGDNQSNSESDDQSQADNTGSSSQTKGSNSRDSKQSSKSEEKSWSNPEDDSERFDRIDELRKEREEQQAGDKQSGDKQSGDNQSGDKQGGDKQAGDKQGGDKQGGDKQGGDKQGGDKQAGDKQAGDKQAGDKQAGEKQAGEKQAGEKQAGEKQAGEKQVGEKQAGEKQAGEKQAGEKQAGEKQAGEKQAGEKQAGEKQAGEKQAGEKQAGEKKAGEKKAGEKQAGENSGNASPGINKEGASSANKSTKGSDTQAENREDPANNEYADKVTDLALDYLKQQRDQPDPELLKRLKWSDEDLKKFLDRWTEAKELAKTDPNKKRERDETLKLLSKRQFKSKEQDVKDRDDELKGFLEEGTRVRPPESLRPGFEQFRKAAGRL